MKKDNGKKPIDNSIMRNLFLWMLFLIMGVYLMNMFVTAQSEKLTYGQFYSLLVANKQTRAISSATLVENRIEGYYSAEKGGGKFYVYVPLEDTELITLLRENVDLFEIEPPKTLLINLFYSLGPILIFILFLWYFAYRGSQQMGSNLWSFGKSRAKVIEKEKAVKITFRDVAGVDEAKEELTEVITFLKDPKRFQRLGGRIPKGVLLVGPPGCGKTLLAKAVAGEASVPFFSISGSDFVELFVGVGASRVRDLFNQAKKASKLSTRGGIIFIDEIDAVGRQRFAGIGGGHDEREQTLNQLLVEMDGFQTEVGIIVMAATNRPDVLDPALLRPGRFDRHIMVDSPDIRGREAILKVHTRKIKLSSSVNLSLIAKQTPGFSGADLANLCNEAALLAARKNKDAVEDDELQEAMERVVAGPQRKSRVISRKEKEVIAFHESGHALLSLILPNVDPLHKVSIVPRGISALGYTLQIPVQDRYLHFRSELLDRLCVLLAGRASEELMLGEVTTGAYNDLQLASKTARKMVTEFGMSSRIGNVSLNRTPGPVFLGRDLGEHNDYSDDTARLIDEEVKRIVEASYKRARKLLIENKDKLELLVKTLLEREVLDSDEVKNLLNLHTYNEDVPQETIPEHEGEINPPEDKPRHSHEGNSA